MPLIRDLLIDQLQDLYSAESQLIAALPKMKEAAHHPKLKEAFDRHLTQTRHHADRLKHVFELLDAKPASKPCKAMMGLVAEGEETIGDGEGKPALWADLALIAAAQRVEHYEISAYGTAKCLARQLNQPRCELLLAHTLGEEERTDFMLSDIAQPLLQKASLEDNNGSDADLEGKKLQYNRERKPASQEAGGR